MKSLRSLALTLALLLPLRLVAEPALPTQERVFVCAHSFMIFTAKMLPPLAEAAKFPYTNAGQQMIGGSRVIQHWNLPDDRNLAKAALREGRVDVLTLSPHRLLPDEGIDNFVKLGLEKNPNLRVLVQASWPAYDGEDPQAFQNEQRNTATVESLREMRAQHRARWLNDLEKQVRTLDDAIGHENVRVVPVSDAVFALREKVAEGQAPGLKQQTDLFRDPIGHPQPALATLVTYSHFAAIYGRSPEGLPVPANLQGQPQAEELNRLLQQLAWQAESNYRPTGASAAVVPAGK